MRMPLLPAASAAALVLFLSGAVRAPASVKAKDSGWIRSERVLASQHMLINPEHPRHRGRKATLRNGAISYTLGYNSSTDAAGELYAQGINLAPNPNWSTNGFIDVRLNGERLYTTRPEWNVESTRRKAQVTLTFEKEIATVQLRFVLRANSDMLETTVRLEKRHAPIESLACRLRCYPGSIARNFSEDGEQPPRDRRILTPERQVSHRPEAVALSDEEFWVLYYDPVWDAAEDTPPPRGAGPCALLFSPEKTKKARVHLRNSAIVETVLHYPPDTDLFRLIVMELRGMSNREAKERVRAYVRDQ